MRAIVWASPVDLTLAGAAFPAKLSVTIVALPLAGLDWLLNLGVVKAPWRPPSLAVPAVLLKSPFLLLWAPLGLHFHLVLV